MASKKEEYTGPDPDAKLSKTTLPFYWCLGDKKRSEIDGKLEEWAKKRDAGEHWDPFLDPPEGKE